MSDPLCYAKMHGYAEDQCVCELLAEARAEARADEGQRLLARIKDRMTDSDLDDLVQDDAKDILWREFGALITPVDE